MSAADNAYGFEFTSIDGEKLPLDTWRGRPVLVVNTASYCGYTSQYRDLEALWRRYRERGLVVLGVPSNDFGQQEPGSAADIKQFCETNYAIDFPLDPEMPGHRRRGPPILPLDRGKPGRSRHAAMEFPQIPDRTRWRTHRSLAVLGRSDRPPHHRRDR